MGSLDFLVSEHSRSRSFTPRLRFGTPTMAERDTARSSTPFRAIDSASSMWEKGAAEQQHAAVLQSWGQTAQPPAPFPAFRKPGGGKFRHVKARYAGPVSGWRMGESNHSRRGSSSAGPLGRHGKAGAEGGAAAAEARLALWQAGYQTPAEGAVLRSDTRRAAGARPPNPPPPMSQEAQAKYLARQVAREGAIRSDEYGEQTRNFAQALGKQIKADNAWDERDGPSENPWQHPEAGAHTEAAAGLHHMLRTVALENESHEDDGDVEDHGNHWKEPPENYSEVMALQISLSQWRTEMDREIDAFPSVALYCEHKLRETFAQPVTTEPDPFRTAVVCALHEKLVVACGRYSVVLATLHTEMMKAIYPGEETKRDELPDETKLKQANHEDGPIQPFYLRTQRLQKENNSMAYELKVFGDMQGFLASQEAQRNFAVNFTHKMALKMMQSHWFVRWKLIT